MPSRGNWGYTLELMSFGGGSQGAALPRLSRQVRRTLPFPFQCCTSACWTEIISRDADLAAFSSDAPVNTATHFPPTTTAEEPVQDPFDMSSFENGLSVPPGRPQHHTSLGQIESTASSDDILGLLARPVESFQKPIKPPSPAPEIKSASPTERESSEDEDKDPRDKAIAAIVEMGFSIGQATKALSQTPDGLDVQMALDNLLSRPSSSASTRLDRPLQGRRGDTPDTTGQRTTPDPFARQPHPTQQHKDLSQIAGEVGTSLWKGAGSLWKSGREKMNTLIQEYQAGDGGGGDPSIPKWMREQHRHTPSAGRRGEQQDTTMTEEARKLGGLDRPAQRPRDRISLAKQTEQDAEMGYRSSARRKVPSRTATPQLPVDERVTPSRIGTPPAEVVDLLSSVPALASTRPSRPQTPQLPRAPSKPATPKPARQIPPISDAALSSSSNSRQKGSEAFKLGDYTQALTHYTSALAPLPAQHPRRIIVLSNRAITNLKLGDAKAAIADCDELIALVGEGGGEGETVKDGEGGTKSLKDIWGKGIVRRASGLEMLEKWEGALEMWKVAVDASVGGTQALDGKRRCERALGISLTPSVGAAGMARSRSIPTTIPRRAATPNQQRSNTPIPSRSVAKGPCRPAPAAAKGPSAVETLAQYNAAAAAEEDEKVGLYDTVDTKITAWQGGKESNLRALLSSLDSILWPEAGWKKVNMAELVVANRVKIVYMKAIAKVHPDKVLTSPHSFVLFFSYSSCGLIYGVDFDGGDCGAEDGCCCRVCKVEWCMGDFQGAERALKGL